MMSEKSEISTKPKGGITMSAPKLKKLWSKPTATAYLQIFGTGSGGTSPSVYLFADSQRYVFSCGEGTQRLFHENKLKLGKINNLFVTQICWDFVGGLPGLLLTLRDTGKTALNVHGPSNLYGFLQSTRPFLSTQNVDINCLCYDGKDNKQFEDENIIVWPICIEGKEINDFSYNSEITEIRDETAIDETTNQEEPKRKYGESLDEKEFQFEDGTDQKRCKLDIHPKSVVSYICQLVQIPGKMKIEKAKALGVPKGPMLGQLQMGQTVTLENGTVVKPEDIMEQSAEGCVFCIIDCPSEDYFDNLISNKQLAMFENGGSKPQPSIIIHLSPADIVKRMEYLNWTNRFGSTCQHLFLNSEMSSPKIAMLSQLRIQYKLHQLNPEIFPRLFASDTPNIEIEGSFKENWKAGESYLIYHLRPAHKIGFDFSEIKAKWDIIAEKVQEGNPSCASERAESTENQNDIKDFIDPKKFLCRYSNVPKYETSNFLDNEFKNMDENFEIVFLGTGASLPSKYRNVSATLVHICKKKLMLLDCGEGTYGQLYRHYGPSLDQILQKICCVFISHIHADHHLGLIRILQAWQKCVQTLAVQDRPDPILVVGPPSLLSWLRSYGTFYETLCLRFVDSSKPWQDNCTSYRTLCSVLEARKIAVVPVDHCHHACGLVLTHKNGWKLVYSGDTRPCENLITEGLGATVIIHEATFEDDLHAEAVAKYHCTTTEAIQCGQAMKAKFILLNHFSQRYPKIPVFNEKFNDCTGIAFDHMRVNFKNIGGVSELLGPLQEIFKDEIPEQSTVGVAESETTSEELPE